MDASVPADRVAYAVILLASLLLAFGIAVLLTLDRRAQRKREDARDEKRFAFDRAQIDRVCVAIGSESVARVAHERERLYRPRSDRPTSS